MAVENLPQPQSPLPKVSEEILLRSNTEVVRQLYAEVVSLRQTLNSVLTHLHSKES